MHKPSLNAVSWRFEKLAYILPPQYSIDGLYKRTLVLIFNSDVYACVHNVMHACAHLGNLLCYWLGHISGENHGTLKKWMQQDGIFDGVEKVTLSPLGSHALN